MRRDKVFREWAIKSMRDKTAKHKVAWVVPEFEDSTLDRVWGLTPVYTGEVKRRRASHVPEKEV